MCRSLVFSFFFLCSFYSYSTQFDVIAVTSTGGHVGWVVGDVCLADSIEQCAAFGDRSGWTYYPEEMVVSSSGLNAGLTGWWGTSSNHKRVSDSVSFVSVPPCLTAEACFAVASRVCAKTYQTPINFNFASSGNFSFDCSDAPNPNEECEEQVIQQCANNSGFSESTYIDNGDGTSSCSGVCADGSEAGASDCGSLSECDVADNNDLDFSSGNTGSSAGSGGDGSSGSGEVTNSDDVEHDVDYEPDGSGTSSSENGGMSSLQGDKLINEVVKSRNDNTQNLTATANDTNAVIIEKSDDIQNTISNSANGIIDAVNNATPFYDGNIVDAINGLDTGGGGQSFDDTGIIGAVNGVGTNIDALGDKIDGLGDSLGGDYIADVTPADFGHYTNIFHGQDDLVFLTDNLKVAIGIENGTFMTAVKDKFSFSAGSGSYQANNLDLGKWGSHDISMARFVDYFGGVGNVIYFIAALTALTIVLGGVKL